MKLLGMLLALVMVALGNEPTRVYRLQGTPEDLLRMLGRSVREKRVPEAGELLGISNLNWCGRPFLAVQLVPVTILAAKRGMLLIVDTDCKYRPGEESEIVLFEERAGTWWQIYNAACNLWCTGKDAVELVGVIGKSPELLAIAFDETGTGFGGLAYDLFVAREGKLVSVGVIQPRSWSFISCEDEKDGCKTVRSYWRKGTVWVSEVEEFVGKKKVGTECHVVAWDEKKGAVVEGKQVVPCEGLTDRVVLQLSQRLEGRP